MVKQVRDADIFCRERTPTPVRAFGALVYHAGASYRKTAALFGVSHEALRQWYLRIAPLFDPPATDRAVVAVDETKINVDDRYVYAWLAIDVQTFEIVHLEVTPGRSSLDALLFFRELQQHCRGKPLVLVDRGPWYNWALDRLDWPYRHETFGPRNPVETAFSVVKHRMAGFWKRFPYRSSVESTERWLQAFAVIQNGWSLS